MVWVKEFKHLLWWIQLNHLVYNFLKPHKVWSSSLLHLCTCQLLFLIGMCNLCVKADFIFQQLWKVDLKTTYSLVSIQGCQLHNKIWRGLGWNWHCWFLSSLPSASLFLLIRWRWPSLPKPRKLRQKEAALSKLLSQGDQRPIKFKEPPLKSNSSRAFTQSDLVHRATCCHPKWTGSRHVNQWKT